MIVLELYFWGIFNFPLLVQCVIDYVIYLFYTNNTIALDYGDIEKISGYHFLKFVIRYCIKFLVEMIKSIYVLGIQDNIVSFNIKEGLMRIVIPWEYVVLWETEYHVDSGESQSFLYVLMTWIDLISWMQRLFYDRKKVDDVGTQYLLRYIGGFIRYLLVWIPWVAEMWLFQKYIYCHVSSLP